MKTSIDVSGFKDFDPSNLFTGPPVYVRKQFAYVGHASTTYSVEQAILIMDYIGQRSESDECLPFAVALVENGEMISISEDNGEFGCGEILATALKRVEGFNVLVCVSRHTSGCFVSDMFQGQKHRAVRDAAVKALDMLSSHLVGNGKDADDVLEHTLKGPEIQEISVPRAVPPPLKRNHSITRSKIDLIKQGAGR